ncbi:hypothetical protein [Capillimicrobium parvum]|uniref:Uncharacterized protein n=1 Tax=Capillimicrobium parvum TaxID=2884022 RepID=A0A9E7BYL1_9ACTN|nr:hypothetical protein [Capillimicrobium parvum]UGS33658.1 hypothetical protein DSM104329_00023 [Capillimicrobium parvum]
MSTIELGRWAVVAEVDDCPIVVGDSITWPGRLAGGVAVCGSHGGATAVAYGIQLGAKGLVLNDAGVGKEQAGISGLAYAERWSVAAATVSHLTARIGDGQDTYASGMVSHVNEDARAAGVVPGMTALAAADLLAATAMRVAARPPAVPEQPKATVVVPGRPPVVAVDSNADADWSAVSAILVTGSHGGVVGARAVTRPVAAAFFNDAGVGKEQAGIGRLPMLDAAGIPGGTVSHDSARIGEGFDTFASGVISFLNETAAAAGLMVGTTLRDAVRLLQDPRP